MYAITIACTITMCVFCYYIAFSDMSSVQIRPSDFNVAIHYIINNKDNAITDKAYNSLYSLLVQSFNLNFEDLNIYNTFCHGYYTGTNKQVIDELYNNLEILHNSAAITDKELLKQIDYLYEYSSTNQLFKIATSPDDIVFCLLTGAFMMCFVIVLALFFPFTYKTAFIGKVPATCICYKNYLKKKPCPKKTSFLFKGTTI